MMMPPRAVGIDDEKGSEVPNPGARASRPQRADGSASLGTGWKEQRDTKQTALGSEPGPDRKSKNAPTRKNAVQRSSATWGMIATGLPTLTKGATMSVGGHEKMSAPVDENSAMGALIASTSNSSSATIKYLMQENRFEDVILRVDGITQAIERTLDEDVIETAKVR